MAYHFAMDDATLRSITKIARDYDRRKLGSESTLERYLSDYEGSEQLDGCPAESILDFLYKMNRDDEFSQTPIYRNDIASRSTLLGYIAGLCCKSYELHFVPLSNTG